MNEKGEVWEVVVYYRDGSNIGFHCNECVTFTDRMAVLNVGITTLFIMLETINSITCRPIRGLGIKISYPVDENDIEMLTDDEDPEGGGEDDNGDFTLQ
jgi:hypothetical protein